MASLALQDSYFETEPYYMIGSDTIHPHTTSESNSSSSSLATPTTPLTPALPEIKVSVEPIPVQKPSKRRFGGLGSLKISSDANSLQTSPILSPLGSSMDRRSSAASSVSSVSSTASKLGRSLSRMMSSSFKKEPASTISSVPRLMEKYGAYVKPERSTKGMGATSRKNVASGATAVIRLVKQKTTGRILAVKEFKKRNKTELERDYQKRMLNEYCISKSATYCDHIVDTLDLVKDEKDRWCVVMEYVNVIQFVFSLFLVILCIYSVLAVMYSIYYKNVHIWQSTTAHVYSNNFY